MQEMTRTDGQTDRQMPPETLPAQPVGVVNNQ